jgi:hypothetical protein
MYLLTHLFLLILSIRNPDGDVTLVSAFAKGASHGSRTNTPLPLGGAQIDKGLLYKEILQADRKSVV